MEQFIRPELKKMEGYSPIFPSSPEAIRLDGNENPYGSSPGVREALSNFDLYHIYPDPEQVELRSALSAYTGIPAQHIVVGSGSDELIDLTLRLFILPEDEVLSFSPTFGMYSFSTAVCGGKLVKFPRASDFSIDVLGAQNHVSPQTRVIFVASPNNPTGNITPTPDILSLLSLGPVVVVDEAYYEFSGTTVAHLVPQYDNLVVLRTLSKWAGLAGLRVGYGIFPQKLASYVMRIKPPYNLNVAAQVAALTSLREVDILKQRVEMLKEEKERLFDRLSEFSFLLPFPSCANFILCQVRGHEARELQKHLAQRGILVRYFDTPELKDYLRISVGLPQHTDLLLRALKDLPGR